jgi:hypothetical protein
MWATAVFRVVPYDWFRSDWFRTGELQYYRCELLEQADRGEPPLGDRVGVTGSSSLSVVDLGGVAVGSACGASGGE